MIVGWFLKEVSAWVKGRSDAKDKRLSEERSRVVEFVHVAETVAATANGLATVNAAAARVWADGIDTFGVSVVFANIIGMNTIYEPRVPSSRRPLALS